MLAFLVFIFIFGPLITIIRAKQAEYIPGFHAKRISYSKVGQTNLLEYLKIASLLTKALPPPLIPNPVRNVSCMTTCQTPLSTLPPFNKRATRLPWKQIVGDHFIIKSNYWCAFWYRKIWLRAVIYRYATCICHKLLSIPFAREFNCGLREERIHLRGKGRLAIT